MKSMRLIGLSILLCMQLLSTAPPVEARWCYEGEVGCHDDPGDSIPDPGCGANCMPVGSVPVILSGHVYGPGGAPLTMAQVYWKYGLVLTDDQGGFQITVWSNQVTLSATKDLLSISSKTFALPATMVGQDIRFDLTYLHETRGSLSRFTNQPQAVQRFEVITSAPTHTAGALNRFFVHTDSDRIAVPLQLDPGYAGEAGWSRWYADWPVAALADGAYKYRACGLFANTTTTCSSASASEFLSRFEVLADAPSFVIDSSGPVFSNHFPAIGHNTLDRRPYIGLAATDMLGSIDFASLTAQINGQPLTPVWANSFTFRPSQDLPLGLSTVAISVADDLGNRSTATWSFDVVELVPQATVVRTSEKTQIVNPSMLTRPAPSYVIVEGIPARVDPLDVTLSSSSQWAGTGYWGLQVDVRGIVATFSNELGQRIEVTGLNGITNFGYNVAVLEPSSLPLGVRLPEQQLTFNLFIPIPSSFVATENATVTVHAHEDGSEEGDLFVVGGDPLPAELRCNSSTECKVSGDISCDVTVPSIGAPSEYDCDGTLPRVSLEKSNAFSWYVMAILPQYLGADSTSRRKEPEIVPTEPGNCTTGFECRNLTGLYDSSWLSLYWSTGPAFAAYGHAMAFSIRPQGEQQSGAKAYVSTFQTSDVRPGKVAVGSVCRRSILESFEQDSVSGLSAWSSSGFAGLIKKKDTGAIGSLSYNVSRVHSAYSLGATGTQAMSLADVVYQVGTNYYIAGDYLGGGLDQSGVFRSGPKLSQAWDPSDTPVPQSDGSSRDYRMQPAELMSISEFEAPFLTSEIKLSMGLHFSYLWSTTC